MRRAALVVAALAGVVAATGAGARSPAAREEPDLPYREGAGPRERVDLYLPGGTGWPTLVFVHGGSLEVGDRKGDSIPAVCRRLAAEGIGCVSVGYRLFSEGATWPTPATDVAAAYAWSRRAVAERGGDEARVFLGGHSSGCMLAGVVGAELAYLEPHGLTPRDVPGIVAMGCRLDFPYDTVGVPRERIDRYFREHPDGRPFGRLEAALDLAPIEHVGPELPPVLVLIAEAERVNPPIEADAARYAAAARAAGREVVRIEILPDRKHYTALSRMAEPDDPTRALIRTFLGR